MGAKINNNAGQWWRASEGWTTWARATRYATAAAAERAYDRAEAAGARPVGVHPTAHGEPPWSKAKIFSESQPR